MPAEIITSGTPLVAVRGYAFPEPSEYTTNTATIVDSARSVGGYVVGNIIRADVSKITVSWRFLTADQWSYILGLFRGSNFYNSVTFFDQDLGTWNTKVMYISDRSSGMFRRDPDKSGCPVVGWVGSKLSLIER